MDAPPRKHTPWGSSVSTQSGWAPDEGPSRWRRQWLAGSLFHRISSFVFSFPPPPEREKVGAVFYIPDFMEIQTPWALPNCPEQWRDNPESTGDFSLDEGCLPVMHRRFSQRGGPIFSPNPAGNGKHKSSHRRKKVGAVFYTPDFMEIQTPRAFPTARGDGGTIWKARKIFLPARADSPVIHRRIFAAGAALSSPQSRMGWEYKTPTSFAKGVGVVFIEAEPIDKAEGKKTEKGWEEHPAFCHNHRERES